MAGKNHPKRKRLFDAYAKNLSFYEPSAAGQFACPICLRFFQETDLHTNPPKLTLAHVVPQSVGGTITTLACHDCNSRLGHRFDADIKREVDFHEWKSGRVSRRAILKYDGGQVPVDWKRERDGHNKLDVPLGQYNPAAQEELFRILSDKGDLQLSMPIHNPHQRNVSYVYTAILAMFHWLGYEYLLHLNMERIRDLLEKRDNDTIGRLIWSTNDLKSVEPWNPGALAICVARELPSCFVVRVTTPNPESSIPVVALPGFEQDADRFWEFITNSTTPPLGQFKFKFFTDSPLRRLSDPSAKWFGHRAWSEFTSRNAT